MRPSENVRDTWAEVDLSCISRNVRAIKSRLPAATEFMAVVKAGGYGHGDIQSAHTAVQSGADSLAVAYLSEAIQLRRQGITVPILVLTPIQPQDVPMAIKHRIQLTVTSAQWFEQAMAYRNIYPKLKLIVHVKFDSGLGRIGIREKEEWEAMVPWLKQADVEVEGAYTHFATAGSTDTRYLEQQLKNFDKMKGWIDQSGVDIRHYHCANSAIALRYPELAMDKVRVGAAMYGFYSKELVPDLELEPALSLHSRLIHVKRVSEGQSIGYDNSYQTSEAEWIGTVPIGYADGWSQVFQSSEMLIGGQRATVVGKIGMDQLMIRLPQHYPVNTQVTIIGKQGNDQITCAQLAASIDGVPQEISTALSARIMRINKGEEIINYEQHPIALC
ncbi:alanine racemase [Cohnella abietis]|uniref:Alanine racemase n=1 Tax=Cohnella abietis TaxID=2507935 RepID=A0A3T1D831_9BACL|nr:alanine racemase [Cohnella abietis]BBI34219.1 alanine racemase [Cohnella abietis]